MKMIDAEGLMRQAPMTAEFYLLDAVGTIDKCLGKGTAKQHPELIAAFIQTCAMDFSATFLAQAIRSLNDALRSDHPLMGGNIGDLAQALSEIAESIAKKGAA